MLSKEEWLEILEKCPDATFFATPEWAEVVEKTYDYKNVTKLFVFEDGQKVLCPLVRTNKVYGIFSQHLSVPFHNYGGFFSNEEISEIKVEKIIKYLTNGLTMGVTICPHPLSRVKYPAEYIADKYSTHILDLIQGFEYIWFEYEDKDQARKARKEGVTIRLGETINDFRIYDEMYSDSAKRWGLKECQPLKLYENLYNLGSNRINLWLARHNEKDIAGIILGYFNEIVVYWGGAFLYEYGRLRPNNLLMIEAIKDACEKGYRYFDFLPSAGIEGVEKFKENFGAEKHEYFAYNFQGKLLNMLRKFKGLQS